MASKRDSRMSFVVTDRVKQEVKQLSEQTGLSESEIARHGLIREMKELQQMCNRAET